MTLNIVSQLIGFRRTQYLRRPVCGRELHTESSFSGLGFNGQPRSWHECLSVLHSSFQSTLAWRQTRRLREGRQGIRKFTLISCNFWQDFVEAISHNDVSIYKVWSL